MSSDSQSGVGSSQAVLADKILGIFDHIDLNQVSGLAQQAPTLGTEVDQLQGFTCV
jgi:hypothetical protein